MGHAQQDSFRAWIDTMPGSPPKLIVQGNAQVNSGGWTGVLLKVQPQGINPDVIVLELRMTPPSGSATTVMTTIPLRYQESPPGHPYSQATIREGQDSFTIDVGRTS